MNKEIVVDLKPSSDFTMVHLSTRDISKASELRNTFAEMYPEYNWNRTPNGLRLDPFDAAQIFPLSALNIDLRPSFEMTRMLLNRSIVLEKAEIIRKCLIEIQDGGVMESKRHLQDVNGLSILDDHQWVNVAGMTLPGGYGLALFDEQGAGKTVSAIFTFDVLVERDEVDFALIISPKSMIPEWENDFQKFKNGLYVIKMLVGSSKDKAQMLREGADIFVTNYETIVSLENEIVSSARQHGGRSILIVDESFFIKNLDAKRTLSIKRIREWFGRAFVLCGTPAPNSPHDIVEQFNIVDFGYSFSGVEIPESKADALPVIQKIIENKGVYLRHLKADVLPNLSIKKFQKIILEMEPIQAKIYRSTLEGLVKDLKSINDKEFLRNIGSFLARRMALLRICSNPSGIVSDYSEVPTKLIALDEILSELIDNQREKVILWSFFKSSIHNIMERYGAMYGAVRYDGTVSDISVRRESVLKFQKDDETMLFVGNPAAAGAGLTLHRAKFAIYESFSNQAAHYLQSLDRIHRRGQERDVEYLILLCDGSIEMQEYSRLEEKELAGRELLGDGVDKNITRESMLDEVVSFLIEIGDVNEFNDIWI